MTMPKSVTKVTKNGVKYVSNVDRCYYTIVELSRAALRDCGKFIVKKFREEYYKEFKKVTGDSGRGCQYWVRKKECDLQVGLGKKGIGWYACFSEVGTSNQPKKAILRNVVDNNVHKIREIQSQYLSGISNNNIAEISEDEYSEE